jgi:putative spermidine/putrescine transport system substrate-binding protein
MKKGGGFCLNIINQQAGNKKETAMRGKLLRVFLVNASICLFVVSLFCLGNVAPAGAERDHLVVQTWGGKLAEAQQKAFFEPFTKMTGIKVIGVEAGTSVGGKLAAMQRSNNIEWDIITADYESYNTKYYNKGFLEEIDYSVVTNTGDLVPGSKKVWGVAQYLEGVCLVYNTKVFPEGKQPKSYKDFFDVKNFPGPRAMHNWGGPTDNLSIALMADGKSPDECLPVDFKRAFEVMDRIKPHIKVWYTSGAQRVQALLDEEVVMAISTDGRAKSAISLGAPIKIEWNQSFYYLAYNCVVKNSPMKAAAMQLLKFCNRPEQQAIFTQIIGYTGANPKAVQYLPAELQKAQSTHPDNINKVFNFMTIKNAQWSVDNVETVDEKWNSWIAR